MFPNVALNDSDHTGTFCLCIALVFPSKKYSFEVVLLVKSQSTTIFTNSLRRFQVKILFRSQDIVDRQFVSLSVFIKSNLNSKRAVTKSENRATHLNGLLDATQLS